MSNKINVWVVERDAVQRDLMTVTLKQNEQIEILSLFDSPRAALRSFHGMNAGLRPDVILFCLGASGRSEIEMLPYIRATVPVSRIIILSEACRESDLELAVRVGIDGWLLKESIENGLCQRIAFVCGGGVVLDPFVAKIAMNKISNQYAGSVMKKVRRERSVIC